MSATKELWRVDAPIGNYYGTPRVIARDDGTFVFELENWTDDDDCTVPVSPEFAAAWTKQFAITSEAAAEAPADRPGTSSPSG